MREIKFRAWEKKIKSMISVDSIDFKAGLINMELAWRMFEDIEFMQYTGLKDKNGVEIYEGDVLNFILQESTGGYFKETYHAEPVEYSEGAFWVGGSLLSHVAAGDEELRIAGNIYDNPELLETN